jgi:hypothetical protein
VSLRSFLITMFKMFYRKKRERSKFKQRPVRVFTQQEVNGFYYYCFVLLNDNEKVLTIMKDCFERWKLIPREFLKRPEIYFYQLLRKKCYLSLGENHKSTEENDSNVYDISINGIDSIDVGQYEIFVDEFWQLRPLSRELLYFWALEHRSVDDISKLIGRKRVEILAQLVDIRAKFLEDKEDAD